VVCRVEGTSVWMWMRNGMIVVRESRRQHRKLDQGWTNGRDSNGARHGSNILVGKIGIFKAVLSKRFSITMFLVLLFGCSRQLTFVEYLLRLPLPTVKELPPIQTESFADWVDAQIANRISEPFHPHIQRLDLPFLIAAL
jgi:hypothetical protein